LRPVWVTEQNEGDKWIGEVSKGEDRGGRRKWKEKVTEVLSIAFPPPVNKHVQFEFNPSFRTYFLLLLIQRHIPLFKLTVFLKVLHLFCFHACLQAVLLN
jgi:hypothetical protein